MMPAQSTVQKSRVRLFFIGHTFSSIGDYAAYVALVILATQRFHSPTKLSFLLLAEFIPAILFGAVLGHWVDKTSQRKSAVAAELLRVGAFIGLASLASFPAMAVMALLAGLGSALYRPSINSGLSNFATGRALQKLFAWQSTINSTARIIGPVLAGIVLSAIKPETLLYANAATFVVSAVIISLLPLDRQKAKGEPESSRLSYRTILALPFRFRVVAVTAGVVALCAGSIGVAEVYFALRDLNVGNTGLAILLGTYGAGMVLGNWTSGHTKLIKGAPQGYLWGMLLLGAGLVATSMSHLAIVAFVIFGVAGLGNGLIAVNARSLVAELVDDRRRGLAYGVKDAFESGGLVLSLLLAGFLVAQIGARGLFTAAGIGVVVTLCGTWLWFKKPVVERAY